MSSITGTFYQFFSKIVHFFKKNCRGGMETKLRETKLKLENSGEMRHTLVLWNQIISAIFRVQAWETKLK
jgi:hypothetical protein